MNIIKKAFLRLLSKFNPKFDNLLPSSQNEKLSLFKSLILSRRCEGIIKIYKGCNVSISRGAKINVSGVLEIGFSWAGFEPGVTNFVVCDGAEVTINGHFKIFNSARVSVNTGAKLSIGNGGFMNVNGNIRCFNSISIGDGVKISENCTISDSDNHILDKNNSEYIMSKPVSIGDHVLIGLNSTILKGVNIANGAVVAAGAVVTKDVLPNTLVGGVPARVIKENINWE